MNYSNFKKCGCNHGGCNHCQSFCPPMNTGQVNCKALGPFLAIDAACISEPANTGTIIPFSSGTVPAVLTSIAGGLAGTASLVGFGTSIPEVNIAGNTIDLSAVANEAFTVPRAGNLTAISASLTALVALALVGTTVTVNATVYRAPAGSNIFTATGATVDLAPPFGTIAVGDLTYGSASFAPIPVAVGDRLLMVFSITASGTTLINTVTGSASAGLTIE